MTETDLPDRGWRGSPDVWLDAAYEALVSGGVDAVKIMPLAQALRLSRSSFYWFFKDRKALLSGLLDRWEASTTRPLVAATRDYAATETEAMPANTSFRSPVRARSSSSPETYIEVARSAAPDTGSLASK